MLPCIVMMGPPGSGKGTHAVWLADRLNYTRICLGDLLRNACNGPDTALSSRIQSHLNAGQLVAPNVVFSLLERAIAASDGSAGIVFDGFPRTLGQMHYLLQQKLIKIQLFLSLQADEATLLERFAGRRIHAPSGRVYHNRYNPPLVSERDDLTGEPLSIRPDDQPEVVLKRLETDRLSRKPLEAYLASRRDAEWHVQPIKANDTIASVREACWQAVQTYLFVHSTC